MHVIAALVSALLLPGFTQVQTGPDGGRVLSGVFPGELRPGLVYLPPGYSAAGRYPVVYLLHGMPGSPSEYPSGTGLVRFADDAIATGTLRPFIGILPAAGPDDRYNGEWAGPWEAGLVGEIVPWVDAHLPTSADAADRVIAGLSAGGFGAVNIALRHPGLFGAVESWSGYFAPLRDGPFRHATRGVLAANDPILLARSDAEVLRRNAVRFFLSTGPAHSHWFTPAQTSDFARELRGLGVDVTYRAYASAKHEYGRQLDAGLDFAFGA
ncbi:MAG TPA: alpha/beta hydrolase-fold protein [Gaiellaceae bacterium]